MSSQKKNGRRLKLLRRAGLPIDGNYCLTEDFGETPVGTYITPSEQRQLLLALIEREDYGTFPILRVA